jgi:hypothetical protein
MRKYYKFKMNMIFGNVLSLIILGISILPVYKTVFNFFDSDNFKNIAILFILYIFWMFLHEILHGIGHMLCGVKSKDLSFGASIEKGVLFCLIRKEVNKKDIMISLLFPFFFIGIVTYIIALIINNPILLILSCFNLSGASVDLLMFTNFIKLDKDITYVEPSDGTSFYIMSNKPINKLSGLIKIGEGEYKENMFDGKYKKFDISKLSYIFFALSIGAAILLLFI